MDPAGPWSTYAPYNRLTAPAAAAADHHHLPTSTAPPAATTAQIIPGGFLSPAPPPVAYETVFTPLFHHAKAGAPAHYRATAAAAAVGSKEGGEYHQAFFEQAGWQQNGPFGILPHEATPAGGGGGGAGNFAHFAAQSLNQLVKTTRSQSPQVRSAGGCVIAILYRFMASEI